MGFLNAHRCWPREFPVPNCRKNGVEGRRNHGARYLETAHKKIARCRPTWTSVDTYRQLTAPDRVVDHRTAMGA